MPAGRAALGRPAGDDGGRGWPAGVGLGHTGGDALVVGQPHGVARGHLSQVADLRPGEDGKLLAIRRPQADLAGILVDLLDDRAGVQHHLALRRLRSRWWRLLMRTAQAQEQPGKWHDLLHRHGAFPFSCGI